MKFLTPSTELLKTSAFLKVAAFVFFSFSLHFVFNRYSFANSHLTFFSATNALKSSSTASSPKISPAPPAAP
ncbi:hypothetical protein L6164_016239 [Bauhinia variegata]|uniref:Uncharacterized protein n=1 Tax=Bauhinia variegata TaxID=167791 RepID=A0ACB9NPF1_BAUVA|nr:hypothetical protein L6164_016239 [Bauhinia variegata]